MIRGFCDPRVPIGGGELRHPANGTPDRPAATRQNGGAARRPHPPIDDRSGSREEESSRSGSDRGDATAGCAVRSPTRAAGRLPIMTVAEPLGDHPRTARDAAGEHARRGHVRHARGWLTSDQDGGLALDDRQRHGRMRHGGGTGAAGCMGAWQCGASWRTLSVMRAAGFPMVLVSDGADCGNVGAIRGLRPTRALLCHFLELLAQRVARLPDAVEVDQLDERRDAGERGSRPRPGRPTAGKSSGRT